MVFDDDDAGSLSEEGVLTWNEILTGDVLTGRLTGVVLTGDLTGDDWPFDWSRRPDW